MKIWMIVLIIVAVVILLLIIIGNIIAAKRRREEAEFAQRVYEGSFKIGFAIGEALSGWGERRNRRK